ncbi:ABC transporter substrate-binding protein [Paenibacillus agricola]|uniref:Extracellular solute-binding protein n=1 Tax=Paenibacillus agricola TaxID=2716264 RepID=A0ABX0JH00_9BACL|nr:extracellular solute-binding protein [Paenibacillus agricola]NHN35462.1 extracellular solute-binding protein [Paenibacillus agricola]
MVEKKRNGFIILLAACLSLAVLLSGCSSTPISQPSAVPDGKGAVKPEDMKATIKVWDWDEAFLKHMIPEFNKVYPNVKVEYAIVSGADYLQKLQSGIASGSDVPDVILGEMAYRGQLYDLGILENLEAAPYNVKKQDLFDYLLPLLTNSKGELVGVDQQIAPGGLAYRRDLAKTYLGTDDPAQLETLLNDWTSFIAKGIEVKEKSGGKVLMMSGLSDAFRILYGQTAKEYIKGKEIDLTSRVKGPLETLFKMRDAGILGKLENNTPSLAASYSKGEFLFYPMAPWGPKWTVAANDKEGKGRWGLVKAPGGGTTIGGTAIGINKGSKVKDAAWAYINFSYLSKEGTTQSFTKFGFPPGLKSFYVNNDLIEKGTEYDAFFGGQNLMKYFYAKIVPEVKGQPQTKYETTVLNAYNTLYPLFTKDTSIDVNSALQKFITEVKNKAPDVTVK